MQIAPGVHQFGTAAVNLFLIETSQGLLLVDTGIPRDTDKLLDQIRRLGFKPEDIRFIYLTHGDIDHIGGAARFREVSGAPILAHQADVALIEGREKRRMQAKGIGVIMRPISDLVFATIMKFTPVKVERVVKEGDVVVDGWQVIHLPGHTAGLIGLYHPEQGVVIAADALRTQGGLGPPPAIFTPDMATARQSVKKVAQLNFEVLGVGHGPPITSGAAAQVRQLAARL